ncbi:MAG TPA: hypothetical protein VFE33_10300 [Thermoanaerobaculia bacterium]|nr:hypothetical protein [Thermoanaerobaculia bacterium]
MEAISELEQVYLLLKLGVARTGQLIDWAIERLQRDEEAGDLDVVLLAGATEQEEIEVLSLAAKILGRYCGAHVPDEQFAAGKYVAELYERYVAGEEDVSSLDEKLDRIYVRLDSPDWLVMLSRNCEYATDVPAFQEPFERELAYVAKLWAEVSSREEFEAKYSRGVSKRNAV